MVNTREEEFEVKIELGIKEKMMKEKETRTDI